MESDRGEAAGTVRFEPGEPPGSPDPSPGPLRGQAAPPPGRAPALLNQGSDQPLQRPAATPAGAPDTVNAAWSPILLALFAFVAAALAAYYAASESLPELSTWADVAALSFLLIPAVFALVYAVLPLWRAEGLLLLALALGALAAILTAAELDAVANFAKAAAVTLGGFWFLRYFENLTWVVAVAAAVPWIDAISVWRGPTRHIVEEQEEIFTTLSIAFPLPGEQASANLGLPDVLFFALFLAATLRFGLRLHWSWIAMTLSFGATLALAVALDVAGLPALPGLCIAFLGANADLIWRRLRGPSEPAPT
jgi:hypothetical protein